MDNPRASTQILSLSSASASSTSPLRFLRLNVTDTVWLTSKTGCTRDVRIIRTESPRFFFCYFFGTSPSHITLISLVTLAKSCLQTPDRKKSRLKFSLPSTTPITLFQNLHSTKGTCSTLNRSLNRKAIWTSWVRLYRRTQFLRSLR